MLKLYPYKKVFPDLFRKEKQKLQRILGKQVIIEHIGSTAIPDIDGKGVIDIMLAFKNLEEINKAVKLLTKSGYYLSNNKNRTERIFMSSTGSQESGLGDIHLHLTTKDNKSFINTVLFRDYLINHPAIRKQYIDSKYTISKEAGQNRAEYTKKKKKFIEKILNLAKRSP